MTRDEEIQHQNHAIQAVSCGLMALVDELHEAGVIDRQEVAGRLSRLRDESGQPMETVSALVEAIAAGNFATTTMRDQMGVIDGGKPEGE